MKSIPFKYAGVLTLLLAGWGHTSPPPNQDLAVRELVAREATIELGAWNTFLADIQPEQITLKPLEGTTRGIQLWEARPPLDHWHRYVVARRGNHLWRLGGFSENDLVEYYNTLQSEMRMDLRSGDAGRYLVGLTDPNGGERIYPTRATGDVTREWLARRSPNWPADTVFVRPDGSSVHRFTVLSKLEHSYDQPWVPMVFTFSFDREGLLQTWHRREGTGFHVLTSSGAP